MSAELAHPTRIPFDQRSLSGPLHDVWDATNALSTFMPEHIASCDDVRELALARRDLDALVEVIVERKREIVARTLTLTGVPPRKEGA
jgi:hypothetical protein